MTEASVVAPVSCRNAWVNAPPPLNVKKGSDEWKLFKQMWTNYFIVARLSDEEDYKRALFLRTLGQEGLIVHNGMQLEENHTLDDIINAFDNHFIGKTNEIHERYMCSTRGTRKLMNQSKITLLSLILLLPHATFVTVWKILC